MGQRLTGWAAGSGWSSGGGRRRPMALIVITIMVVMAAALAPQWAGAAAEAPPSGWQPGAADRMAIVDLTHLPPVVPGDHTHPDHAKPFLTPPGHAAGSGTTTPSASPNLIAAPAAGSAPLNTLAGFPAMSLDQQITAFGSHQNLTPPDSMMAAGPTQLLETINDSASVWTKGGARVASSDLNSFFRVPTGYAFSDPRVIYDAPSGRWFMSGLAFTSPSFSSLVYLAVSSGSDATGSWTVYAFDSTRNVLHDQPKVGVSADKVVLSWNDFRNGQSFSGAVTLVLDRSQLLAGVATLATSTSGPDIKRASIVPAQDLGYSSGDTTAYAVYNTGGTIGVIAITGSPVAHTVASTESDPAITATSAPPAADQPGAAGSIATNDDRFVSAVWRAGTLWTSGNDACTPPGDSATRPCARCVAVATSGSTVTQDFDLGVAGSGVYYPAVGVAPSGDMVTAFSSSSSTAYPGVVVAGLTGGALTPLTTLQAGQTSYNDDPCYNLTGPSRWGDYSAVSIDPSTTAGFWAVGEFATRSTLSATSGCAWATQAAEVAFPVASTATAAPSPLGFGNQQVGQRSAARTVTVTNNGSSAITVGAAAIDGANATDFGLTADACSNTTVAGAGQCTVGVTFDPSAFGARSATLSILSNASNGTQTLLISGTGDSTLVAVAGSDGGLWSRQDGQPRQGLGGALSAAPTVVTVPDAQGVPVPLYLAVGTDHNIYERTASSSWARFSAAGFSCLDAVGATVTTSSGASTLTVACEGSDQSLWAAQTSVTAGALPQVSAFTNLGGQLTAGPAVASLDGTLSGVTFVVDGTGGALYSRTMTTAYAAMSGVCLGRPALATSGSVAYFACRGADGGLWYALRSGGVWGPYRGLGGTVVGAPGVSVTSSAVTVWVEGSNGSMYSTLLDLSGTPLTGWTLDGGVGQFGAGATGLISP